MSRPLEIIRDILSAVGVALMFPLVIIIVGLPVVLVVRLMMAAAAWW